MKRSDVSQITYNIILSIHTENSIPHEEVSNVVTLVQGSLSVSYSYWLIANYLNNNAFNHKYILLMYLLPKVPPTSLQVWCAVCHFLYRPHTALHK